MESTSLTADEYARLEDQLRREQINPVVVTIGGKQHVVRYFPAVPRDFGPVRNARPSLRRRVTLLSRLRVWRTMRAMRRAVAVEDGEAASVGSERLPRHGEFP
jgi:hypothetical protein